jgi:thiosulfate reductase cytochrome b subunit
MKRSRWTALFWLIPAILVGMLVVVLVANWLRGLPSVASFMTTYPGQSALPASAPVGFPAWVEWQHFLNAFFLIFIVRTGWQMRAKGRPAGFWTRNNSGVIRTKNPPVRIGLPLWFHLSTDILWTLNGVLFFVLIFATGQWMRLVPLSWDIIPNAISVGIQYASLHWPHDDGWSNYNALQTLSYFVTVFLAAPLALLTGIRMSPGFAARFRPLDRVFPTRVARGIHYPVMVYFVAFTIVHVTLVLATGALRNLNHMYAGRDDETWWGFGIFAVSIIVMVVAWIAAKPTLLASIAGLSGTVRR